MINFFNDYSEGPTFDMPDPKGPLPVDTSTPWYKAAGMGFMKGAADIAGAATIVASGVVGLMEGGAFEPHASDKVFKFYDDYIKPARDYWTPDPESVSTAGRIIGGISGLGPSLMLGPGVIPALIGTSAIMTGADLAESGVDAATATGLGILSGVSTGAMVSIPAAGKTLAQTLALIATNPVIGGAQEAAQKGILQTKGYDEQAEMFNPYDPANRAVDLVMGGIFGGLAHYGRVREAMPVHFNDAMDTASLTQKNIGNSPFEAKYIGKHTEALNKAVEDISEGRPVDVAPVIENLKPEDLKKAGIDMETAKVKEAGDIELKASEEEAVRVIEGPKEPEKGDFGPVFTQFKDKPQEAVKHLLEIKTGEAAGALHHDSIGPIDLVWGKEGTSAKNYEDGYGLAKIAQKHPEILNENLQDIISPMVIRSRHAHRISLESPDHRAAVKLEWEGKEKRWLVTAFKKEGPSRTEGIPSVSGNKGDAPPASQDGLSSNIEQSAGKVNPPENLATTSKTEGGSIEAGAGPKASVNASVEGKTGQRKESTSIETDSLADFIRKNGGLSMDKEFLKGEIRDRFSIKGGYNLVNNKTGKTLDRMREIATESGYLREGSTITDFLDALRTDVDAKSSGKLGAVWSVAKQDYGIEDAYLAHEVERYLRENPDMQLHTGTDPKGEPVMVRARELLDTALVEVKKAESAQDLFNMAADCLRMG